MKKKILYITTFLLLVLFSCEKEYVAPVEVVDPAFTMGVVVGNPVAINVGESFSFRDASQGATGQDWIIENGNYFLMKGFDPSGDSLDAFRRTDVDTLLKNETTAFVQLNKPGINTIRLKTYFNEETIWIGSRDTLNAYQEDGRWVIDTAFEVDVYETIQPEFKVYKDGIQIIHVKAEDEVNVEDAENWPMITVEAGSEIQYVDLTTVGRPAHRWWNFNGSSSSTGDSAAVAKYYSLGVYSAGYLRPGRGWPLPSGSTTKLIPLNIQVIKSTMPFVKAADAYETEDGYISVNVTGEVAVAVAEEQNFVLHVTNGDFEKEIAVQNVMVNPEDKTQIMLEPAEELYNSDIVTVEYKGGNITSVDERVLAAFEASGVTMYVDESLDLFSSEVYSFEVEGNNPARGGSEGWWTWYEDVFIRQDVTVCDGNWAWKFNVDLDAIPAGDEKFRGGSHIDWSGIGAVQPGLYQFSVMMLVEQTDMQYVEFTYSGAPWKVNKLAFDLDRKGEWQTFTHVAEFTEEHKDFNFSFVRTASASNSGVHTIYIDDIKLIPLEVRPTE